MPIQITDDEQIVATANLLDNEGNATSTSPAGATPAWTVSDPTALTLSVDSTGLIATVVPAQVAGKLGAFQLAFSDGATINVSDTITVVADVATQAAIVFGTPSAIVAVAPAASAAPSA